MAISPCSFGWQLPRYVATAALCAVIVAVDSGCAHYKRPVANPRGDDYLAAAKELDKVARSVERYGTISVSAPYVIQPSEDIAFDLNRSAKDYYEDARTEGFAQVRSYKVLDAQIAVSANLEEVVKALKALQSNPTKSKVDSLRESLFSFETAQQALSNEAGFVSEANLTVQQLSALNIARDVLTRAGEAEAAQPDVVEPVYNSPEMPALLAKSDRVALSMLPEKFTDPLPTFTGDLGLSPRQKIMLASNDKMTQDLLKWFSFPDTEALGPNKVAYLCLLMVSCEPGYLTRAGFAAEVTVDVQYGREEAIAANGSQEAYDEIRPSNTMNQRTQPLVAAAYPMLDAQVLDLASSVREQLSFAAQLMASGYGVAGQAVMDYAQRLEHDARTRSAVTVGSATSYGGQSFGFRVEPRLVALSDPASRKSTPAMKLESKAFPALVLLVADKSDISKDAGGTGEFGHLMFEVESRWVPTSENNASSKKRLPEEELMIRAQALDNAFVVLQKVDPKSKDERWWTLRRRHALYTATGAGATTYMELPHVKVPAGAPAATWQSGQSFVAWLNQPTVLAISGDNLLNQVGRVTVGGINCEILDVRNKSVVVQIPGWPEDASKLVSAPTADVWAVTTNGDSQKIGVATFSRIAKSGGGGGGGTKNPMLTIERDASGNITKLELQGDEAKLVKLDQLKEILTVGGSGSFALEFEGSSKAKASVNTTK